MYLKKTFYLSFRQKDKKASFVFVHSLNRADKTEKAREKTKETFSFFCAVFCWQRTRNPIFPLRANETSGWSPVMCPLSFSVSNRRKQFRSHNFILGIQTYASSEGSLKYKGPLRKMLLKRLKSKVFSSGHTVLNATGSSFRVVFFFL